MFLSHVGQINPQMSLGFDDGAAEEKSAQTLFGPGDKKMVNILFFVVLFLSKRAIKPAKQLIKLVLLELKLLTATPFFFFPN